MDRYRKLQDTLARGWNTWNTRSFLSHVLLPQGFAVNLGVKDYWQPHHLKEALMGVRGPKEATCRPAFRSYDGAYTDIRLYWRDLRLRIQTALDGDDWLAWITPEHDLSRHAVLVAETGILWNRPGRLEKTADGVIRGLFDDGEVRLYPVGVPDENECQLQTQTPYWALPLGGPVGLCTGRPRSAAEVRGHIEAAAARVREPLSAFGDQAEVVEAIQTCIAWNTIHDPIGQRAITPVSRDWSAWPFGGYVLFGWDTFFAARLAAAVGSPGLAYANAIAMASTANDIGFVPNWIGGTGCVTLDRSMPQVGGLMAWEIYRSHPARWFLEEVFPPLLTSNRWIAKNRTCDGFVCLGSNAFKPVVGTWEETNGTGQLLGAKFEFGLDNSPMYDDVPFDAATGLMRQADVGQMSLHLADCLALAEMADVLGRAAEATELRNRAEAGRRRLSRMWDDEAGLFRNLRLDTGRLSPRISPTTFYPLLCDAATPEQVRRLVEEHLFNENEFWGEWVLPTTPRDDPAFADQDYWRGKIWAPVNFLVWTALRRAGQPDAARRLSERSRALLLREWREHGHVHENYSADTGLGCDRPDSDSFYQWGGLLGLPSLMEREESLSR